LLAAAVLSFAAAVWQHQRSQRKAAAAVDDDF